MIDGNQVLMAGKSIVSSRKKPRTTINGAIPLMVSAMRISLSKPLAGEKTLSELALQFVVHPSQITDWKRQLNERAGEVFGRSSKSSPPVLLWLQT